MVVGNASGPVAPQNLGILSAKGSLYVTRPTLGTYIAARADLVKRANDLFNAVKSKKVKIETTGPACGKIVIDFHSDDEFERLLEYFS